LSDHYREYLPPDLKAIMAWQFMMQQVFTKSAALLEEQVRPPGRLLDVGCGYGFFPAMMARRGWQAEGIEISPVGREYARCRLGIAVSAEPLPRPDLPVGSFDVISLFYVIEHLPDPVETLREVHRLLRSGGLLLLRWPHTTPIVRLLKPWAAALKLYQAPSHLFDFSPRTMESLLQQTGFRTVRTTICGWTRPGTPGARLASALFGSIGERLARSSGARHLLPGVSKTTVARSGRCNGFRVGFGSDP
jgi:SAM-dependent methyltransferase